MDGVGGEKRGSLNRTRCRVDGLENKRHSMAFGQLAQDVARNGITVSSLGRYRRFSFERG